MNIDLRASERCRAQRRSGVARARPAPGAAGRRQVGRPRRELDLRDLYVALGDAAARPALGGLDQTPAEDVELVLVVRELVGRELDPDLVDRGLALLADLVALFRDDRDLADLGQERL